MPAKSRFEVSGPGGGGAKAAATALVMQQFVYITSPSLVSTQGLSAD